jgi:hypothetical protein
MNKRVMLAAIDDLARSRTDVDWRLVAQFRLNQMNIEPGFYGASTGMWRAETRGAPSAAISNNSRDGHDANDAD